MKKNFFGRKVWMSCTLFFMIASSLMYAQASDKQFKFPNNLHLYDAREINMSLVEDHFLGEGIAIKMHLMKNTYTKVEEPTPTSPTPKTIVLKPYIYYSVKKLSRYYKKGIKKNEISAEEAQKRLDSVIEKALSVFPEETEELEETLRKAKKQDQIEAVYNSIVLY